MMSHRTLLALIITFLTSLIVISQEPNTKVLFVIADGISSDVLEKIDTPHLDLIAGENGYARAYVGGEKGGYSQSPTISAVGYNSLLTGTWANKHNVWGNGIEDPNYNYWNIFRMAREYRPQLTTAIFSTWLDNRTKLVGEMLATNGNIKLDYHFDGFEHDTIRFPHEDNSLHIHKIDEHVVDQAAKVIKESAPDLSWVYLQYTDDMGHRYGDSEPFYMAVKTMDLQMGKLWEAIHYRTENFNEKWQLWITTDHGRNPKDGKGHGGQSDRERSIWIVTNEKELNDYYKEGQVGLVDIVPTILHTLDIQPNKEQLWEMDGVPLSTEISLANAKAMLNNKELVLTWDAYQLEGTLDIWITTTNNFASGGTDAYTLAATVAIDLGKATIDQSQWPSNFYKVLLSGEHNAINRWVMKNN
ncbi:alkaline phosphatase family protein [Arenibacter amylolyticus]|uniref:alkaline phosphatase family protein n=1 Tax=Arenibacter amylolyticus TaxID=1406873 RepID=UPI001FE7D412|nr:alkaline phosphatase family protein [Arenibacter amylolyticus]